MSKIKGPKTDYRVEVTPRRLCDFGGISMSDSMFYKDTPEDRRRWESNMQERCTEIADSVRRHADNVAYVAVKFDQSDVCQHCGAAWTEKSADYNGGCCDKDEAANPFPVADQQA